MGSWAEVGWWGAAILASFRQASPRPLLLQIWVKNKTKGGIQSSSAANVYNTCITDPTSPFFVAIAAIGSLFHMSVT